ncbi:hypothetical protein Plhal304r1_c036g0110811 [Plasmopara halstedii]
MEVLTRPAGSLQSELRVISDSSMTMTVPLPSSFLRTRGKPSTTTIQSTIDVENTVTSVDKSWEERDWETADISLVNASEIDQNGDEWEEETTPDLPDHFPRLIVNLTKVQRHHFPASKEEENTSDIMEVFHRVKNALQQHFTQLAEGLFEQKLCFHCTYGTTRTMLNNLHTVYPDDTFAMIDYPLEIDSIPLREYLHILSYPSKWKSVEYLKDCLRQCSRDIKWKRDVILELELLAESEFLQYEEKLHRLSDEIDELTRLRDSFREKLVKLTKPGSKANNQCMMLRRLEDIELRLVTLLNEYLKEPELEETEYHNACGNPGGEGGIQAGMNVLDMVIAMIFCRQPRDFCQHITAEDHFQMLFDYHIHILRLWKKDFGRLPPHTRAAPKHLDCSDSDFAQKECQEQVVPDESDQSLEEQTEAFSSFCRVDDDKISDDSTSVRTEDDWECVNFKENDNCSEKRHEDDVSDHVDLDGYGADYDSNDSEDERTTEQVQFTEQSKSKEVVKVSTRSHRRHIKRTSKRSKQRRKVNSERHSSKQEHGEVSFEPFACIGAVNLLRHAKENEMF